MSFEITKFCPVSRPVSMVAVPQQVQAPAMVADRLQMTQGVQIQLQQLHATVHEFEHLKSGAIYSQEEQFYCKFCLQYATQQAWTSVLSAPADTQNGHH